MAEDGDGKKSRGEGGRGTGGGGDGGGGEGAGSAGERKGGGVSDEMDLDLRTVAVFPDGFRKKADEPIRWVREPAGTAADFQNRHEIGTFRWTLSLIPAGYIRSSPWMQLFAFCFALLYAARAR